MSLVGDIFVLVTIHLPTTLEGYIQHFVVFKLFKVH